jgi:hypothetical protein
MQRNRLLVTLWGVVIVAYALSFAAASDLVLGMPFAAIVLAVISVFRSDKRSDLVHRWPYRIAVGLMFAASATVLVAAGSTVVRGNDHVPLYGFIGLATTNLVVSVLSWRALTRPSARFVAIVAVIAMVTELVAAIFDIVFNIFRDWHSDAIFVALGASVVTSWLAAFVSIAALTCFAPAPAVALPEAREL